MINWFYENLLLKSSIVHVFLAMYVREPLDPKALIIVCCKWLLVHKVHCCRQDNLLPTVEYKRIFDIFLRVKETKKTNIVHGASRLL